jgi:ribonuclease HII
MPSPDFTREAALSAAGCPVVAGVDEAGRGPLAGPVVAAAVILDPARIPRGLDDSKRLKARERERLFDALLAAATVSVGRASVEEIDRLNILRASHLAMVRAVQGLAVAARHAIIDGNLLPDGLPCPATAVIGGDALCLSVAAASVVAKVTRDRDMVALAQQHPGYGWEKNMGYPTAEHRAALVQLGITPHHRRSFAPVHKLLYQENSVTR